MASNLKVIFLLLWLLQCGVFYYWIDSRGQTTSISRKLENVIIPSGKENTTATLSYDYRIMPLENTFSTGTYYCRVEWNDIQQSGKGVFVLARGTGYVETSYGWEILITLTALLATLSITATALFLWKKVLCPRRNQLNILRQKVETQPPSANLPSPPPPPPSVYDCLDLQQVDVYSSILENNTNNLSSRKNLPGKRPKKQTTLEESSDTLYENI